MARLLASWPNSLDEKAGSAPTRLRVPEQHAMAVEGRTTWSVALITEMQVVRDHQHAAAMTVAGRR